MANQFDVSVGAMMQNNVAAATEEYSKALLNVADAQQATHNSYLAKQSKLIGNPDNTVSNEELDTVSGTAINTGLAALDFLHNTLAGVVNTPLAKGVQADMNKYGIGESDIALYSSIKAKNGENLTAEEQAFMTEKQANAYYNKGEATHNYNQYAVPEEAQRNRQTRFEIMEDIVKGIENQQAVADFASPEHLVNNSEQSEMAERAGKVWDEQSTDLKADLKSIQDGDFSKVNDVVAKFANMSVDGIVAALVDEDGRFELSGLAQLLGVSATAAMTSAAAPVLSMMGQGSSQEAIAEFMKVNKRLPTAEELNTAETASALKGIIASQSDRILAAGAKAIPTAKASGLPKTVASKATKMKDDIAAVQNAASKVSSPVTGTVTEGAAEAAESVAEQYAVKQDMEKVDGREVFSNYALGAAAGGLVATGGRVVDGIESGSDAVKKTYEESTLAIDEEVTEGNLTTPEAKKMNSTIKQGADAASKANSVLQNASRMLNDENTSPEVREEVITLAKSRMNNVKATVAENQEYIAEYDSLIDQTVEAMNQAESKEDKAAAKKQIDELTAQRDELTSMNKKYGKIIDRYDVEIESRFQSDIIESGRLDEVKSRVSDFSTAMSNLEEGTYGTTQATHDAVTLTEAASRNEDGNTLVDALTLEQASKNPTLTKPVQGLLAAAAEVERIVTARSAKVSKDIIQGGVGFVGIRQYQSRITSSLNSGLLRLARKDADQLNKFADHMEAKVAAYDLAIAESKESGQPAIVQGFVTAQGKPISVTANTEKALMPTMREETAMVRNAATALDGAVRGYEAPVNTNAPVEQETSVETPTEAPIDSPEVEAVQEPTVEEAVEEQAPTEQATDTVIEEQAEPSVEEESTVEAPTEQEAEVTTEEEVTAEEAPVKKAKKPNRYQEEANKGAVRQAPKAKAAKAKFDARTDADKKYEETNHVQTLIKRGRGLMDSINITNQQAVEGALGRTLTVAESAVLSGMKDVMEEISKQLTKHLRSPEKVVAERAFQSERPVEMFSREDGTFSESFKSVIGVSVMEYLERYAASLGDITNSGMARLLGVESKDFVPSLEAFEAFENAGVPSDSVISNLGRIVMKNLGLAKNKNAPLSMQGKIEYDLGRVAFAAMVDSGILMATSFKGSELNELGGNYANPDATVITVKVSQKALDGITSTQDMSGAFKYSNNLIESLTTNEAPVRKAEIGKRTQKVSSKMHNSGGQKADKAFVEGANKDAAEAHFIDMNMHNVFTQLGEDRMASIMGEEEYHLDKDGKKVYHTIKGLLPAVVGKARTIKQELERYAAFIGRMADGGHNLENTPFFYNYRFSRNLRLMIQSADINFQTSKLHRYLTRLAPSEVDMSDPTNKSFVFFKLAVLQGLGYPTDKQNLAKSLYDFEEVLVKYDSEINILSRMMMEGMEDTISQEDLDLVAKAARSEEGVHSLKSLVALAEMYIAGDTKFNTTVTYEIDGITNGAFNAHVQMGLEAIKGGLTARSKQRLNQGGFLTEGHTGYLDYISDPANWDIYQTTAMAVNNNVDNMFARMEAMTGNKPEDKKRLKKTKAAFGAIASRIGSLVTFNEDGTVTVEKAGRNLAKPMVTKKVYNAGNASIADGIAMGMAQKLMEEVKEAYSNNDEVALANVARDISAMTGGGNVNLTMANAVNFNFDKTQIDILLSYNRRTIGTLVRMAMEEEFSQQLANSALVTQSANAIFHMFNVMYQQAIDKKLAELVEQGKRSAKEFLTENELEKIKESLLETMPIFRAYYGKTKNGIQTSARKQNGRVDARHADMFKLSKSYDSEFVPSNWEGTMPVWEAPNANPMAMTTISMGDATVMARAAKDSGEYLGLNVFDARVAPIRVLEQTKAALNKAEYTSVMNHSQLGSVQERFGSAITAFRNGEFTLDETRALRKYIWSTLESCYVDPDGTAGMHFDGDKIPYTEEEFDGAMGLDNLAVHLEIFESRLGYAVRDNNRAKKILKKGTVVANQFEGFGDGVTYVNGKLQDLGGLSETQIADAVSKAEAKIVEAGMNQEGNVEQQLTDAENKADDEEFTHRNEGSRYDSTIGDLADEGNIPLDALLENADKIWGNTIRGALAKQIIAILMKHDSLAITINEVDYQINDKMHTSQVRGWYEPMNHSIVLNGKYLAHSGVNPDTLLHEMIHAGTSLAYELIMAGNEHLFTKAQVTAAKRIKALYEYTLTQDSGMTEHGLVNAHEFMAWGLTNLRDMKILNKMPHKMRKVITELGKAVRQLLRIPDSEASIFSELSDNVAVLMSAQDRVAMIRNSGALHQATNVSQALYQEVEMRSMDSKQLYDEVAKTNHRTLSSEHSKRLDSIMDGINSMEKQLNNVAPDVMANLDLTTRNQLETMSGKLNYKGSPVHMSAFNLTNQESYVYAKYALVLKHALKEHGYDLKQLRDLYQRAKKQLTVADFFQEEMLNTEEENKQAQINAQARYDAVFGNTNGVDYLVNFLALSQASETFHGALERLDANNSKIGEAKKQVKESDNLVVTAMKAVTKLMDMVYDWLVNPNRVSGTNMSKALDNLALNLRHVNTRNKLHVLGYKKAAAFTSRTLNRLNEMSAKGIDKTFDKVIPAMKKVRPNIVSNLVKASVRGLSMFSQSRAAAWDNAVTTSISVMGSGRENFVQSLITESRGTNVDNHTIHSLSQIKNKRIDHDSKRVQQNMASIVKEMFNNPSETLAKALTKVILRADLVALSNAGMDINQIQHALKSVNNLKAEVARIKADLRTKTVPQLYNYYTNQAVVLGDYLATGNVTNNRIQFNAANIYNLHGTGLKAPEFDQDIVNQIDALITLETLIRTDGNLRTHVVQEIERNADNVETFMAMHAKHKERSLKQNFQGFETGMHKGHISERPNGQVNIRIADIKDEAEMNALGYVLVEEVGGLPKNDLDGRPSTKRIYKAEFGEHAQFMQGILSTNRLNSKGTSVLEGYFGAQKAELLADLAKDTKEDLDSLFTTNPKYVENGLAPVYNQAGRIIDYRYMASNAVKDNVLGVNYDVSEVFSYMEAGTLLKSESSKMNKQLVDVLKAQYERDRKKPEQLARYVRISEDSVDPEMKEIWMLIPEETKEHIRSVFGDDSIVVRRDLLNVTFGYRKYSVRNLWKKGSAYQKASNEMVRRMAEAIFGTKGMYWAMRIEKGWIDTVRDAKDMVVIKSIIVLRDNIISNLVQLPLMHGVSPVKALKHTYEAFNLAGEYMKLDKELFKLQQKKEVGTITKAEEVRLSEVAQDLANNPIKPLMDAGMMATIVEDVEVNEDSTSPFAWLANKARQGASHLPEGVQKYGKEALIVQDSQMYKTLHRMTSLSDLAARYALYQHDIKDGMTSEQAIAHISDAFVNYDLPTHQMMQYLNDMGVAWFFKYTIRMQKVILAAAQGKPVTLILAGLLMGLTGMDVPNPVEANAFNVDFMNKLGIIDGMSMAGDAHPLMKMF